MGKTYEGIDQHWRDWIARQSLFFVGSAPLDDDGHVNVSPKGPIGSFSVLDERTVAYLDVVGSGAETIAHIRENGRVVVLFCAFEGPPRILRLLGRGEVVPAGEPRFGELLAQGEFDEPSIEEYKRSIVVVHVHRIADSCGYGVPLLSYEGERPHGEKWAAKKLRAGGEEALEDYKRQKNSRSLDDLPALEA